MQDFLGCDVLIKKYFLWRKAYQDYPIPTIVEFNVQEKTSFGLQSQLSLILLKLRHFFSTNHKREREREREGKIIRANLLELHCRVVDKAIFPNHNNRPPFRAATRIRGKLLCNTITCIENLT